MAQEHSNTAERELLKIIEGKSEIKKIVKPDSQFKLDSLLKKFSLPFSGMLHKGAFSPKSQITPGKINNLLIAAVFILMVSFGLVFMNGAGRLKKLPHFDIPTVHAKARGIILPLREYTFYIEKIIGRNIFSENIAAEQANVEAPTAKKINDMVKDLRLTGISWSEDENERFVMLEDIQAKITYFLKEGETISKSNVSVKKVFKDKVILTYLEEEIEIR